MRLPKRKSVPFDFTFDSKKDGGKNEFDGAKSRNLSMEQVSVLNF